MACPYRKKHQKHPHDVDLSGKIIIVTGANTGIGYITTKELYRMNGHIILACRDLTKANDAITKIQHELANPEPVVAENADNKQPAEEDHHDHDHEHDQDHHGVMEAMKLDLGSLQSIREFADAFHQKNLALHILINNAGVVYGNGTKQTTSDGFEGHMGINHLGPFLLTNLLLEDLKKSAPSRIINVSSSVHKGNELDFDDLNLEHGYGDFSAYGKSKLANILFTKELQHRLEGTNVTTNCLHPGLVNTELARDMHGVAGFMVKNVFSHLVGKSPEKGAETSIFLATSPTVEGVGGKYYADSKEAHCSDYANNAEHAKRLWEVSEQLVHLK